VERFPSGPDMEALIRSCGFAGVRTRVLSFGIASLYECQRT